MILNISVRNTPGGDPLEDASIVFESTNGNLARIEARTNSHGTVAVDIPHTQLSHFSVLVTAENHDPGLFEELAPHLTELTFELPVIPAANDNLGWWHRLLGISRYSATRGTGISIGVIDSGISPDADLRHVVDGGFFNQVGRQDKEPGRDESNHGIAVLGLMTARPVVPDGYSGIAPGAKVISTKAFHSKPEDLFSTGTNGEVQEAMNYLIKEKVDLINCSFSGGHDSAGLEDVIEDAYQNGVLCICAAGNKPETIGYPARSKWTVSVSAIGFETAVPVFVPDKMTNPELWQGECFVPTFSGRGVKITCCAPGVGMITNAMPIRSGTRVFRRNFGTSFATPLVCGTLAAALSDDKTYLALPRNEDRASYAAGKLTGLCRSLGLDPHYQGAGMPVLRDGLRD